MYISPIELIQSDIQMKTEEHILKAVQGVGVNVDKEELIKAIKYDRHQYEKGYADGMASVQQWIPCSKKLPEMHDAGRILKKVGIKQRSKRVYITIEAKRNDGGVERITDAEAELRDGEWYSDTLRWLKAAGKIIEVTAWMPYPEPYNPEGDEKA